MSLIIVIIVGQARLTPVQQDSIAQIVNYAGVRSQKAQGLGRAITSYEKLLLDRDQVLHLACLTPDDKPRTTLILGMLKFGKKKLFLHVGGGIREVEPMCCLDFYVHESCQRIGIGRALMDVALAHAGLTGNPHKIGYDRPSPKLLKFLGKHYGLHDYTPQNNNFVVYNAYFDGTASLSKTEETPSQVLKRYSHRWIARGHDEPTAPTRSSQASRAAGMANPRRHAAPSPTLSRTAAATTSATQRDTRHHQHQQAKATASYRDAHTSLGRVPLATTVPAQQRTSPPASKALFPWLTPVAASTTTLPASNAHHAQQQGRSHHLNASSKAAFPWLA